MNRVGPGLAGATKAVVPFHRRADSLPRALLVIEYCPQGRFEKTGNVWEEAYTGEEAQAEEEGPYAEEDAREEYEEEEDECAERGSRG